MSAADSVVNRASRGLRWSTETGSPFGTVTRNGPTWKNQKVTKSICFGQVRKMNPKRRKSRISDWGRSFRQRLIGTIRKNSRTKGVGSGALGNHTCGSGSKKRYPKWPTLINATQNYCPTLEGQIFATSHPLIGDMVCVK